MGAFCRVGLSGDYYLPSLQRAHRPRWTTLSASEPGAGDKLGARLRHSPRVCLVLHELALLGGVNSLKFGFAQRLLVISGKGQLSSVGLGEWRNGRRAWLRTTWGNPCRFESCLAHQYNHLLHVYLSRTEVIPTVVSARQLCPAAQHCRTNGH